MRIRRDKRGFTLIELLIVVAIIGIIVAIAIPNLLNAIQRAKQKRTMADMRSIGTALEAYAVDYNRYPAAAGTGYSLPSGISTLPSTTIGASCAGQISPTYIRTMPMKDGWNSYFCYGTGNNNLDYALLSNGKNGTAESFKGGPTTDFNDDIIFADGQFIQYPEGTQK